MPFYTQLGAWIGKFRAKSRFLVFVAAWVGKILSNNGVVWPWSSKLHLKLHQRAINTPQSYMYVIDTQACFGIIMRQDSGYFSSLHNTRNFNRWKMNPKWPIEAIFRPKFQLSKVGTVCKMSKSSRDFVLCRQNKLNCP